MSHSDVFLTHDWGEDESERSNHERVSRVNKFLQARGVHTWFDEERMTGNIRDKMAEGIENSKVVVVFITEKYRNKVNSNNAADNCYFEFNYATLEKTGNFMVPVVMERRMRNPRDWKGRLGAELGSHLYVDLADDEPEKFDKKCEELLQIVQALITAYDKVNPPSSATATPHHHHLRPHESNPKVQKEGEKPPSINFPPSNEDKKTPLSSDTSPPSQRNTEVALKRNPSISQPTQRKTEDGGTLPISPLGSMSPRTLEKFQITSVATKSSALANNAMAILSNNRSPVTNASASTTPTSPISLTSISTGHVTKPSTNFQANHTAHNILSQQHHTTNTTTHPLTSQSASTTANPSLSTPTNDSATSNLAGKFSFASSFLKSLNDHNPPPTTQGNTSRTSLHHNPSVPSVKAPFLSHPEQSQKLTGPTFSFASSFAQSLNSQTTASDHQKKCPWCSSKNDLTATHCVLCKKPIDLLHSSGHVGGDVLKKTCPWCHGKNDMNAIKCSICSNSLEKQHLPSDLFDHHVANDYNQHNNSSVNIKVSTRAANGENGVQRSPRLSFHTGAMVMQHLTTSGKKENT